MSRAGMAKNELLNFWNTDECDYNESQVYINAFIVFLVTGNSHGST